MIVERLRYEVYEARSAKFIRDFMLPAELDTYVFFQVSADGWAMRHRNAAPTRTRPSGCSNSAKAFR